MSHCRWVVVSEDCYQELTKAEAPKEEVSGQTNEKVEHLVKEVQKEEKKEEQIDWTQSLPPSYRKEGQQLIQKLLEYPGFSISSTGIVELDQVPLLDYTISSFLRSACIPFNKSPIPMQLQDWLRETGMTIFQNHLLKILPKWENRYSWRKSTMASRKEPSVDPKPSTRKRKA